MNYIMIFEDGEKNRAMVDYIERLAETLGATVEIQWMVAVRTEDERIAVEVERRRRRQAGAGEKTMEAAL